MYILGRLRILYSMVDTSIFVRDCMLHAHSVDFTPIFWTFRLPESFRVNIGWSGTIIEDHTEFYLATWESRFLKENIFELFLTCQPMYIYGAAAAAAASLHNKTNWGLSIIISTAFFEPNHVTIHGKGMTSKEKHGTHPPM